MRLSLSLSIPLLLALGACANPPMTTPQEDLAAKQFQAPAYGKGALYVYRQGLMAFALPVDVSIVGGAQAQLNRNNYMRIEGPPGPIEVACNMGGTRQSQQVEIGAGQVRFVEVTANAGLMGPTCSLSEVAPGRGEEAVRGSRRVAAM